MNKLISAISYTMVFWLLADELPAQQLGLPFNIYVCSANSQSGQHNAQTNDCSVHTEYRQLDHVYQEGIDIGQIVEGATRDELNNSIRFSGIETQNRKIDFSRPLEYQQWRFSCDSTDGGFLERNGPTFKFYYGAVNCHYLGRLDGP